MCMTAIGEVVPRLTKPRFNGKLSGPTITEEEEIEPAGLIVLMPYGRRDL
jgi:hypothetical protein